MVSADTLMPLVDAKQSAHARLLKSNNAIRKSSESISD